MTILEFRFPAGRYHATPWYHHVNEGFVEWPPAPWRLLRALVAMWHYRVPSAPRSDLLALLERLSRPPSYVLPSTSWGHARHYMPVSGKQDDRTLVFDSFLSIDPNDPLYVVWPELELTPDEEDLLDRLVSSLPYLGRAESWVRARLVRESLALEPNAVPAGAASAPPGGRLQRLLVAKSAAAYRAWRDLRERSRQNPGKKKRKGKKDKMPFVLPEDLLGCLELSTADLRNAGWSLPPGAEWRDYVVSEKELRWSRDRSIAEVAPQVGERPTVAIFGLAGDTEGADVRPLVIHGLGLAETFRKTLMAYSKDESDRPSPIFSGKDEEGRPLEGHRHAFILPSDEDGDGRIDCVVVYCREGFGDRETKALAAVRKLWQSKGLPDLFPLLIGLGAAQDYASDGLVWRPGRSRLLAEATEWTSATPYIPTRHPKKNGKDSPEEQVVRDLRLMGFPEPRSVERVRFLDRGRSRRVRWLEFATQREGGGSRGSRFGFGFRIRFAEPVRGPIALGYGAHFGLGLFRPANGRGGRHGGRSG